jgi:heptosyltransferase-2
MAVIKRCDIFLGNCSGPMHIAAALGVPVVVIFGDIHPLGSENKWAPLGPNCLIVRKAMDCVDCHPGHCRDYKCMKLVTVEDVMSAMETQIARLNK